MKQENRLCALNSLCVLDVVGGITYIGKISSGDARRMGGVNLSDYVVVSTEQIASEAKVNTKSFTESAKSLYDSLKKDKGPIWILPKDQITYHKIE